MALSGQQKSRRLTLAKSLLKSSQQEEAPLEPKLVFLSYKQATPLESTNDITL